MAATPTEPKQLAKIITERAEIGQMETPWRSGDRVCDGRRGPGPPDGPGLLMVRCLLKGCHADSGRHTVKAVPVPGVLVSSIRPPCARTSSATTVRPTPLPGRAGGGPAAPEPVEQVRQLVGLDSRPGIGDDEPHRPAGVIDGHRDRAAGWPRTASATSCGPTLPRRPSQRRLRAVPAAGPRRVRAPRAGRLRPVQGTRSLAQLNLDIGTYVLRPCSCRRKRFRGRQR